MDLIRWLFGREKKKRGRRTVTRIDIPPPPLGTRSPARPASSAVPAVPEFGPDGLAGAFPDPEPSSAETTGHFVIPDVPDQAPDTTGRFVISDFNIPERGGSE